ncbi:MAG: c-type cytochrome [Deltaproteobacteria bacterium]|nr:c-type cytochrome [Deltaproteobacteria bacterium]MBI3296431.1 c-type cytochrome [Deltaproteobacteria bacterium]
MHVILLLLLLVPMCARGDARAFLAWLPDALFPISPKRSVEDLPQDRVSNEIRYGFELFRNTALYLGPQGSVGQYLGNRTNCQNCHLDAGTRLFGGSLRSAHGSYPQYRDRNANFITLSDRINQCIERPHHGRPLPLDGREIKALMLYMRWLGESTTVGERLIGDDLLEPPLLARAASPEKGRHVFATHCARCHGDNGEGKLLDHRAYLYPPLWGPESFSIGSSMHRVRKAAAFIKYNMPFGTSWKKPLLTDEEAYDVAAFIDDDRIHPRPLVDISHDYPDLIDKPLDYAYGPFNDPFSEEEHKFGPFEPIHRFRKGKGTVIAFKKQ